MKDIFNSNKICVKGDDYNNEFIIEFSDVYEHYIDEIKLDMEEMKLFVKTMAELKEKFG